MKEIKLTKGMVAIVDDDDYERINKHKWYSHVGSRGYVYAVREVKRKGVKKTFSMHREIMGITDPNIFVDHISHNTLDNRKSKLRVCSRTENKRNSRTYKNSTTGYKGVSLHKKTGKYYSSIRGGGKRIHIGSFDCPIEAAKAYDSEAIKLHGEFAKLNFPL